MADKPPRKRGDEEGATGSAGSGSGKSIPQPPQEKAESKTTSSEEDRKKAKAAEEKKAKESATTTAPTATKPPRTSTTPGRKISTRLSSSTPKKRTEGQSGGGSCSPPDRSPSPKMDEIKSRKALKLLPDGAAGGKIISRETGGGIGTEGRPTKIRANYFEIILKQQEQIKVANLPILVGVKLCRYWVNIHWPVRSDTDVIKTLPPNIVAPAFWEFMRQHPEVYENDVHQTAFDGRCMLYSQKDLVFRRDDNKKHTWEVTAIVQPRFETNADMQRLLRPPAGTDVRVIGNGDRACTFVVTIHELDPVGISPRSVTRTEKLALKDINCLSVLQIVVRQGRTHGLSPICNEFFMPGNKGGTVFPLAGGKKDIGGGIENWQGLFMAPKIGFVQNPNDRHHPDPKLLVNCDVGNSPFFAGPGMPAMEYFCRYINLKMRKRYTAADLGPETVLNQELLQHAKDAFKRLRVYTKVTVKDPEGKNIDVINFHVINGVADTETPDTYFFALNAPQPHGNGNGNGHNGNGHDGNGHNGNGHNGNGGNGNAQQKVSVTQYFKDKYKYDVFYKKVQLLVAPGSGKQKDSTGKKMKTHLPWDVVYVAYPQKNMKALQGDQTAATIKEAALRPPDRKQRIEALMAQAHFDVDPFLRRLGVGVNSTQMVSVSARILPPPTIVYPSNQNCAVSGGEWRPARNTQFYETPPKNIQNWILLYQDRDDQQTRSNYVEWAKRFASDMRQSGIPFTNQNPYFVRALNGSGRNAYELVEQARELAKQESNGESMMPDFCLCVVKEKNSEAYGFVKRACETRCQPGMQGLQVGIVSQCVIFKTVQNWKPMTAGNIALKVNAKLGGCDWRVMPASPRLKSMMAGAKKQVVWVIGADVIHGGPGDFASPSIAGVVVSTDDFFMRYLPLARVQKVRREHIVYLAEGLQNLIMSHKDILREPERVIYYRDGVSEGQMSRVMNEEIQSIRHAIDTCYSSSSDVKDGKKTAKWRPFTAIVAAKRHHTRLFPEGRDASKTNNVLPGTTVDTDIVHPEDCDFFQVAHHGIQGTCRPVHYTILLDDADESGERLGVDTIQQLTYNLTHHYQRCTKSVHVPAPIYYADLLCARAKRWCEEASRELQSGSHSSDSRPTGRRPKTAAAKDVVPTVNDAIDEMRAPSDATEEEGDLGSGSVAEVDKHASDNLLNETMIVHSNLISAPVKLFWI